MPFGEVSQIWAFDSKSVVPTQHSTLFVLGAELSLESILWLTDPFLQSQPSWGPWETRGRIEYTQN